MSTASTGRKRRKEAKPPADPPLERAEPSRAEKEAIRRATSDVRNRAPRLKLRVEQSSSGEILNLGAEHEDDYGWVMRLQSMMATNGIDLPISALNQLVPLTRTPEGKIDVNRLNSMLAIIEGAQPTTELEAVLACQMAATHFLAMQLMVRTHNASTLPQFDAAGNMAVKMLRTFTAQAEALAKLQKKHSQTVRVEHVHVHAGGQAVVGNVSREPHGGRDDEESRNQPHAKAALAADSPERMPQVWCEDEERPPVPRSGGEG